MTYSPFPIFGERELHSLLQGLSQEMKQRIYSEQPDYILTVNDEEYFRFLVSTYSVEPFVLDVNTITVDSHEERIPAERFPNVGFDLKRGGSAIKQVIRYHIPLSGNEELLRYAPSSGLMWSTDVFVNGDSLCFDVIDFYGDPERIKREADQILKLIGQQAANVTREIDQYNNGLRAAVSQILQARREQVQKQHQVLSSLGVPIRKSVNIPETFVVPSVRKKSNHKAANTAAAKRAGADRGA